MVQTTHTLKRFWEWMNGPTPTRPELEVVPSISEQLRPRQEVLIEIDEVITKGDPEYMHISCLSCGDGMLVYNLDSLRYQRFGRHILISQIWAYRCNNPSCDSFAILPEVSDELRELIEKAQAKSLSTPQV